MSRRFLLVGVRAAGLLLFAGLLATTVEFRRAARAQGPQSWSSAAHEAAPLASLLLREYPLIASNSVNYKLHPMWRWQRCR